MDRASVALRQGIGMYGPPQSCKRKTNDGRSGLRKCIRPSVESLTPGHDGNPLALIPINWTVSLETFADIRFRAWGTPIAIAIFRQQTWHRFKLHSSPR